MASYRRQPVPLPTLPPPPPAALQLLASRTTDVPTRTSGLLPTFTPFAFGPEPSDEQHEPSHPPLDHASSNLYFTKAESELRRLDDVLDNRATTRKEHLWAYTGSSDGTSEGDDGQMGQMVLLSRHRHFVEAEVKHHDGVLVVVNRGRKGQTEEVALERMPMASRVGMRLLYHGLLGREKLLDSNRVEKILKRWSIREGKRFDSHEHVLRRIEAYIQAYDIDCSQLLEPDLTKYATLNAFFYRKLDPLARPIAAPSDPTVVSSAADCRLTVFPSVKSATKLWIKGQHFTLARLLQDPNLAERLEDGCVAIFRLAPADYHRFHAPFDAVVGQIHHISGDYYTVNSLIVRDKRFDPLAENKRDITVLSAIRAPDHHVPVAFCQIGALLVASIRQTVTPGDVVHRGDELGYFAYGGSTIVLVAPHDSIRWDKDILQNSAGENAEGVQIETLVKMGERIGKWLV
ncbi:hypothetical protein JCM5296_001323 [Sporobolomyces johnsonii]